MKKVMLTLALAVAAIAPAMAQQQGNNSVEPAEGSKVETPEAATMLQVAGQLVKYGYEQESALPLIQAIEIYQNVAGSASRSGQKESTTDAQGTDGTKQSKATFDVAKLLADATTFADGDENLLAIIDGLKNGATRGATRNYATHYDSVNARSTDTYRISFRGGERACVIVSGDGDTDLDLYVYDENGNLVGKDVDNTDDCVVVWNPRWTGPFTIKIKNLGNVYNRYAMMVN